MGLYVKVGRRAEARLPRLAEHLSGHDALAHDDARAPRTDVNVPVTGKPISSNQCSSVPIGTTQLESVAMNQSQSVAISRNQSQSVAISRNQSLSLDGGRAVLKQQRERIVTEEQAHLHATPSALISGNQR
jgi:hypothetical protein